MSTGKSTDQLRPASNSIQAEVSDALRHHWRLVLGVAVSIGTAALILGGWYFFWGQPVRTVVYQPFRPTFLGASTGKYPNNLPFGTSDITAGSVLDTVFDTNSIQDYCQRASFKSGFFIDQHSAEYSFLESDYLARLGEAKTTSVERDRLQAEFQAKQAALPLEYRLVFAVPQGCAAIPAVIRPKVLSDVLSTWAEESDGRRGVLRHNVQIMSPAALDFAAGPSMSRLIRADLVRGGLHRLSENIDLVEDLPGAALVKLGANRFTFAGVQMKVDDLIQARLEPLIISAGRDLGRDSAVWAAEALASATRNQRVAEGNAQTFLDALREYSGTPPPASTAKSDSRQSTTGSSDVQALTPQIDRTFVDRIVELSAPNMAFRQELTRSLVHAKMDAVKLQADVSHYQHLVDQLLRPGVGGMSSQMIDEQLAEILTEGKALAQLFNELYEEFSRVALRASAAMYRLEGPAGLEVSMDFPLRSYLMLTAGAFIGSLLVSLAGCLAWRRWKATPNAAS